MDGDVDGLMSQAAHERVPDLTSNGGHYPGDYFRRKMCKTIRRGNDGRGRLEN